MPEVMVERERAAELQYEAGMYKSLYEAASKRVEELSRALDAAQASPDQQCLSDMTLANNARVAAIEECARIADDNTPAKHQGTLVAHVTGSTIAKSIRALSVPSAQCECPVGMHSIGCKNR